MGGAICCAGAGRFSFMQALQPVHTLTGTKMWNPRLSRWLARQADWATKPAMASSEAPSPRAEDFQPRISSIMRIMKIIGGAVFLVALAFSQPEAVEKAREPEAISLLGRPLYSPVFSDSEKELLEANLEKARRRLDQDPDDPDALIWVGRRLAYLGRYREAIEVYTRGIEKSPRNPKIYRHRGHRYISVRRFDLAAADLERAARLIQGAPDEIEPDGIPNSRNQPRSTLHTNVWYHLGLAYYLQGDFENAARCYRGCLKASQNDDMLTAVSHWLYMTLRRMGRPEEAALVLAPISAEMDVIENQSYWDLLLFYKGEKPLGEIYQPEDEDLSSATIGYGVGCRRLYNGRRKEAEKIFRRIVESGPWSAFGFIAAEAELARGLKK